MKKTIIFFTVLITASLPAFASAYGWSCRAESNYAVGFASGYQYQSDARARALNECAIRTPYHATCYIVNCWWVR